MQVITVPAYGASEHDMAIATTREALAGGVGKTGELIAAYAEALTAKYGKAWWEAKGEIRKAIKVERTEFDKAFAERGIDKPSANVYWQRTKEAAGKAKGIRASASTDPGTKNMTDLKTIINRISKMEEDGVASEWIDYKSNLVEVFEAMGGELPEDSDE